MVCVRGSGAVDHLEGSQSTFAGLSADAKCGLCPVDRQPPPPLCLTRFRGKGGGVRLVETAYVLVRYLHVCFFERVFFSVLYLFSVYLPTGARRRQLSFPRDLGVPRPCLQRHAPQPRLERAHAQVCWSSEGECGHGGSRPFKEKNLFDFFVGVLILAFDPVSCRVSYGVDWVVVVLVVATPLCPETEAIVL